MVNHTTSDREPIAIVGMGCRFPGGASGLKAYWENLRAGIDAICDVPKDRWDTRRYYSPNQDRPGKSYAKQGGFLQEPIDQFDPMFFGIPPREAECMDPQQRLLLEVCWEAFEDAGVPLDVLRKLRTGVFVGGFTLDNMLLQLSPFNRHQINANTPTSGSMAVLANRLSHVFDLTGPSIAMDTACSSSLVATHIGCQSIWNGESDIAVVGGVNVMLLPNYPVSMSKGHFLSPHARCKAFDEDAAGYTRGEGAGIVVLRPYKKALENGDHIYALIGGTGINQDGHTTGMALPNGDAQERLIRDVYERAGVSPRDISYFEAHGTGTQAGDMTEMGSLQRVLGENRAEDQPCFVGSVKTQIGHLEAAAGVAALIKSALCMHHKTLVPNLHFENPNPNIDFTKVNLQVCTQVQPWEAEGERLAGINSFGYGGTNAHVLLREAPSRTDVVASQKTEDEAFVLPLSAKSETALRDLSGRYAQVMQETNIATEDLIYTATQRRSHLTHRMALVADSQAQAIASLTAYANGEMREGIEVATTAEGQQQKLVFVFTGMGPQWAGMGQKLYAIEPVFQKAMDRFDRIFSNMSGWSLLEDLKKPDSRIGETAVAQPANLMIQMALTDLLKEKGIVPDGVIGHSVGEVAAAWASGALSDEDAIAVIYHRSRLQQKMAHDRAGMLAVGLSVQALQEWGGLPEGVDLAAVNSPTSITLSGDKKALEEMAEELEKAGIFNRFLQVEVAYHSMQMVPIEEELKVSLADLKPQETHVPLYSTVKGACTEGCEWDGAYWWENVRRPVQFAQAVDVLLDDGFTHFLEVGPHPVLGYSIRETVTHKKAQAQVLQSLNRKTDEHTTWMACLAALYTVGYEPHWQQLCKTSGQFVKLPHYPWQKEQYWFESDASRQERIGNDGPVFFYRQLSMHTPTFDVEFNDQFFPYATDHKVQNSVVFPGAGYVAAGLALHKRFFDAEACLLENLRFHAPLVDDPKQVVILKTQFDASTNDYAVYSQIEGDDAEWKLHAQGHIRPEGLIAPDSICLSDLQKNFSDEADVVQEYRDFLARGLDYGPNFQVIKKVWKEGDHVLAQLVLDEHVDIAHEALHPALLDGTFQMLLTIVGDEGRTYVPASIDTLKFYGLPNRQCWAYGQITRREKGIVHGDVQIFDASGQMLAEYCDLQCRAISTSAQDTNQLNLFYDLRWQEEMGEIDVVDPCAKPDLILAAQNLFEDMGDVDCICHDSLKALKDEDFDALLRYEEPQRIGYMWGLEEAGEDVAQQISDHTTVLTRLVQAIDRAGLKQVTLDIVTQSAHQVCDDASINVSAAPLWHLGRVIANEYPQIAVGFFDLDHVDASWGLFVNDWLTGASCQLWAYRNGVRFTRKIVPTEETKQADMLYEMVDVDACAVKMDQTTPGDPGSLFYRQIERRAPKQGEVEVRVHTSALNFKDLLKIYGRLDADITQDTYLGHEPGSELSGVVTRVGSGVTKVKPGDEIIATEPGAFCSYITIPDTYVVPKPQCLSFEEAPVMVNFLTAYYGLEDVARLEAGEKVLIHNGSGGVGLAAIQIARWKKADIYTTAGTDEKRAYLKSLGITHIYDSRTVTFAEEIRRDTQGYGVDVVLSAQADEALIQSFRLLAPYGRYVEIGKKNIGEDSGLPMRSFNKGLSFTAFDLDRMFVDRPVVVQRLLRALGDLFDQDILQAIPVQTFHASETDEAFRFMAQGQHMGKIVVKYDGQVKAKVGDTQTRFAKAGTYLVTGGTSGFGLAVGEWLAQKGAGHIVLASRSGAASEVAQQAIGRMEKLGAQVRAEAVDVTNLEAVIQLVNEIESGGYGLKGVFHSAMVLDDGFLKDMDETRLQKVIMPKVAGALNLHEATKVLNLECFVCFSSVSSLVGNPGQANYVVANGFLDAFAHARHAQGLPALTVNWGALGDAGVVARNAELETMLAQSGIRSVAIDKALSALETLLDDGVVQRGVFDVDWAQWATVNPMLATTTEFADLTEGDMDGTNELQEAIVAELLPLEPFERQEWVQDKMKAQIATVLKCGVDQIDANQSVSSLGVDSLMAVELSVLLKSELAVDITTVDLLGDLSIARLTDKALENLITEEDELLAQLDDMSEEELDAILETQT